jgi:hypothetical protein
MMITAIDGLSSDIAMEKVIKEVIECSVGIVHIDGSDEKLMRR